MIFLRASRISLIVVLSVVLTRIFSLSHGFPIYYYIDNGGNSTYFYDDIVFSNATHNITQPLFANKWNFEDERLPNNVTQWETLLKPMFIPRSPFYVSKDILDTSALESFTRSKIRLPRSGRFNPIELTVLSANNPPSFKTNSPLMWYMETSLGVMSGNIRITELMIKASYLHQYTLQQNKHFNHIRNERTNTRHRPPSIVKNIQSTLNRFRAIKERDNVIIYHVECPGDSVKMKVIIQGVLRKNLHDVELKCNYFRLGVRNALERFNYKKNFTFLEIPSEWLAHKYPYILIDETIVPTIEILNFAFTPPRHNNYYYTEALVHECKHFKKDIIAHQVDFQFHLNQNITYCINDVFSHFTSLLFGCDHDLFYVLLHELSHFFISSCHSSFINTLNVDRTSNDRDLSPKSRELFERAWEKESLTLMC